MTASEHSDTLICMQEGPSGNLPLSLLLSEIDEVGRSLARLVQPGSPVARERRKAIRAVLRDAVLATQGDGDAPSFEELSGTLARLRELKHEIVETADSPLTSRLGQRRGFGVVDNVLLQKGTFKTAGEQRAGAISDAVNARIERTLSVLSANKEADSKVGTTRPLRHREELQELVTKKVR